MLVRSVSDGQTNIQRMGCFNVPDASDDKDQIKIFFRMGSDYKLLRPLGYLIEAATCIGLHALDLTDFILDRVALRSTRLTKPPGNLATKSCPRLS